ncbi:Ku protein [Pseudonocardiaceae bacterium YIM PH 21723]|nr:Ku protein [Pseudonocardiaceae bacterium YIM PH 21723]
MSPIWRGAISFGLVNIAVRLHTATEEHDFHFHQIHRDDNGRIRYKRVCEECGKTVQQADIVKGYPLDDGSMITLEPTDFEELPVSTDKSIEVLEFVPVAEVDPIYFQRTYYLEPDKAAIRPYVLLRETLRNSDRLGVVRITIRQREQLAVLRVRDEVIALHTMLWPDEIRTARFDVLRDAEDPRKNELTMAGTLVENMAGEFHPDEHTDEYREALGRLIEAKAAGKKAPARTPRRKPAEPADLADALQRSVEATKKPGRRKKTA